MARVDGCAVLLKRLKPFWDNHFYLKLHCHSHYSQINLLKDMLCFFASCKVLSSQHSKSFIVFINHLSPWRIFMIIALQNLGQWTTYPWKKWKIDVDYSISFYYQTLDQNLKLLIDLLTGKRFSEIYGRIWLLMKCYNYYRIVDNITLTMQLS